MAHRTALLALVVVCTMLSSNAWDDECPLDQFCPPTPPAYQVCPGHPDKVCADTEDAPGMATCGQPTCTAVCNLVCNDGETYEPSYCSNSGGGNCQGVKSIFPPYPDFHGGPCCGCKRCKGTKVAVTRRALKGVVATTAPICRAPSTYMPTPIPDTDARYPLCQTTCAKTCKVLDKPRCQAGLYDFQDFDLSAKFNPASYPFQTSITLDDCKKTCTARTDCYAAVWRGPSTSYAMGTCYFKGPGAETVCPTYSPAPYGTDSNYLVYSCT